MGGFFLYLYLLLTLSIPTPWLLCVAWGGGGFRPPLISQALMGLEGCFFGTMGIYPRSKNKKKNFENRPKNKA